MPTLLRSIVGVVLLTGCMMQRPSSSVTPADSTKQHGHEFESLAVAALLALILIPALAKKPR